MIFYSVVPDEVVFEGMDRPPEPYMEINVNGLLMQVQSISPYQAKIVRLYSPNPQHYLNPAYAPGSIIDFRLPLKQPKP